MGCGLWGIPDRTVEMAFVTVTCGVIKSGTNNSTEEELQRPTEETRQKVYQVSVP